MKKGWRMEGQKGSSKKGCDLWMKLEKVQLGWDWLPGFLKKGLICLIPGERDSKFHCERPLNDVPRTVWALTLAQSRGKLEHYSGVVLL